jgi:hypothetical protein
MNTISRASIIPPGGGHVWFGPETHKRRFGVGLFHQVRSPISLPYFQPSYLFIAAPLFERTAESSNRGRHGTPFSALPQLHSSGSVVPRGSNDGIEPRSWDWYQHYACLQRLECELDRLWMLIIGNGLICSSQSLYDEASRNYYEHEEWKKSRGIHSSGHEY